jgi:endonuclease/exonuclease/phosphatase family metal-dependent hydrolase
MYMPQLNVQKRNRKSSSEDLNRCCNQIPKHDALLILGDFNAKIGKELANQSVAGQHTIHEETSENGLILCQFVEANESLISSTF